MSLRNKLLILLMLPMVLQILLAGSIYQLYVKSEELRQRAEQAHLVSELFARAFEKHAILTSVYSGDLALQDRDFHQNAERAKAGFNVACANLGRLLKDDSDVQAALRTISTEVTHIDPIQKQLEENWSTTEVQGGPSRQFWWADLRKIISQELLEDLNKIDSKYKSSYEMNVAQAVETNKKLAFTIVVLCVVVAGFFVGGTIFLLNNIGTRFRIMKENTFKLASSQPLNAPLGGTDEIADMDKTFHMMAKSLSDSTKRERAIIDNAKDVICTLSKELRFESVNTALENLLERGYSDILTVPLLRFCRAEDEQKINDYFLQARTSNQDKPLDLDLIASESKTVSTVWSVVWFQDLNSYLCVVHDVTERRKLEQMRSDIFRMVTHDIRTPLTTIDALITFLEEGYLGELNERGVKMTGNASQSVRQVIGLVNDFLVAEKLDAGDFELDLNDEQSSPMVAEALSSVTGVALRKKISLTQSGDDVCVSCDRDRIIQVIVNLLGNAIKFSSNDSEVKVSVEAIGDWVEFQIIDHGRGIPEDQLDHVFEKFKQVSSADSKNMGGAGLGLSICKSMVEKHGGQIGVRSKIGEGSTFWFRLPTAKR